MPRRAGTYDWAVRTNSGFGATIGRRTRISLYGDESARCSGSNRLDLLSASSACMPWFITPAIFNAISFRDRHCGSFEPRRPTNGRVPSRPRDRASGSRLVCLPPVNLTMRPPLPSQQQAPRERRRRDPAGRSLRQDFISIQRFNFGGWVSLPAPPLPRRPCPISAECGLESTPRKNATLRDRARERPQSIAPPPAGACRRDRKHRLRALEIPLFVDDALSRAGARVERHGRCRSEASSQFVRLGALAERPDHSRVYLSLNKGHGLSDVFEPANAMRKHAESKARMVTPRELSAFLDHPSGIVFIGLVDIAV